MKTLKSDKVEIKGMHATIAKIFILSKRPVILNCTDFGDVIDCVITGVI